MKRLSLGRSLALLSSIFLVACEARTSNPPLPALVGIKPAETQPTSAPTSLPVVEQPLRYVFAPRSTAVRISRSIKSRLLGRTLAGARLPVYEEKLVKRSGCKGSWLRVQYGGWVCEDKLLPSIDGEETELHYENLLPTQSAVVLKDTPSYARPGEASTGTMLAKTRVSVIRLFELNGGFYAQLKANVFVDASALKFKGRGRPSTLQGVWFDEETQPPLVFFVAKKTRIFAKSGLTKTKDSISTKARYESAMILEEATIKGRNYLRIADGWLLKKGVAIIRKQERPKKIPADSHWALVDLSEKTLSAYDGDTLVFATLVSPGKEGHDGAFRTVTGSYRIQSKSRYTTMRGNPFGEAYEVKNVPWTQYFYRGYGLHGTFWHDRFGAVASHGCVNMSAQDAKIMSDFLEPVLPPGWLVLYPPSKMATSIITVQK